MSDSKKRAPASSTNTSGPQNVSGEFLQTLRDINRKRTLLLMLGPRKKPSDLTPIRGAILALLWEFDSKQRGPRESRIMASSIGELIGLHPNGISPQLVSMTDAGLCEELPRESRQDRRVRYYAITPLGRTELDRFLDSQYLLESEVYRNVELDRARNVLDLLRKRVESLMTQLLHS